MKARVLGQHKLDSHSKEVRGLRSETSMITCWCVSIALHQKFGFGQKRQERMSKYLEDVQQVFAMNVQKYGYDKALEHLINEAAQWVDPTFLWPFLPEPPKDKRKAQQLLDIANEVATTAWCMMVISIRQATKEGHDRFGSMRFARLKHITQDFIEEFCENAADDKDWAWVRIQRCVQMIYTKESITVVDESDKDGQIRAERWVKELHKKAADSIAKDNKQRVGAKLFQQKTQGLNVLSTQKLNEIKQTVDIKADFLFDGLRGGTIGGGRKRIIHEQDGSGATTTAR